MRLSERIRERLRDGGGIKFPWAAVTKDEAGEWAYQAEKMERAIEGAQQELEQCMDVASTKECHGHIYRAYDALKEAADD